MAAEARLQLRIHETLRNRIETEAGRKGLSLTDYAVAAIAEKLDRDEETATRITIAREHQAAFFQMLDDRSPLSDEWDEARKLAADIAG
jgi:uncharacterized protein (DUF1778 family)